MFHRQATRRFAALFALGYHSKSMVPECLIAGDTQ
jgi:hypothetical protein